MHEKEFSDHHQKAVVLVDFLKKEMDEIETSIQNKFVKEELERLTAERNKAKEELEILKTKVIKLEIERGIKQVPLCSVSSQSSHVETFAATVEPEIMKEEQKSKPSKKDKEVPLKKKEKPKAAAPSDDSKDINVSRLDLRIGRIVAVEKHPDADSLYVEKIELGEDCPRTVVSGLVKFVPLEQMQNRKVVVLCNLKPVKMRGVLSEAMVMCASTPEKVEILNPPADAVPGDRVSCDDYPGEPDAVMNPKKKIFEQVAPDLKTNDDCVATYKTSVLKVGSKGMICADSLANVQIK